MREATVVSQPRTTSLPASPYKGLVAYDEADAEFFFGREIERELIAANLMAARLTVLYGPSGVGKTSVINAGVAHDLAEFARQMLEEEGTPRRVLVVFRTWRGDPAAGLAEAVAESVRELLPEHDHEDPPPDATLVDVLRHWADELDGRLLIVLDQFEEYFVYASADERFDEEFPRAVNRTDVRANFLVSIREDALAKLDRFKGRIPYLFDNYLRIDRLDLEAARLAVEAPLRRWAELGGEPVAIEKELVDLVLEEVRPDLGFGQSGTGTADTERPNRVEATFLQLVMSKLWEVERAAGSRVLRVSTLHDLGDAKGIVRAHLNEGLDLLSPEEKDVAAHVFQFLVTRSGHKVAHTADDLADFTNLELEQVTSVLDRLSSPNVWILRRVDAVAGEEGEEARYEIYHDTLGEPILAWRSAHLQRIHERRAVESARKARRRAKLWAIGAGAMLAVAAACLVLLFVAIGARRTARSQGFVAQSEAALDVDPNRAVLLAQKALSTKKTHAAETAFRRAVGLSPLRVEIQHGGEVSRAEYSRDGKRVFAVGAEGTASVSDARTGRRLTTIGYGKTLFAGDLSWDGRRAMTAGADGTVRLWNADTGKQLAVFRNPNLSGAWLDRTGGREVVTTGYDGWLRVWRLGSQRPIVRRHLVQNAALSHAAVSPDGGRVVAAGSGPTAWIVDARTGRALHVLKGHTAAINAVVWSPDGRLVATGGDDRTSIVWDAATGTPLLVRDWGDPVGAIAFSADGKDVAVAAGTRIYVLNPRSGMQIASLRGHTDGINDVEFRKGGQILVSASDDGTARVWNFAFLSEKTLRTLLGDRSNVDTAVFSPDGRSVLTGSADGTARIWDVSTGRELWGHFSSVLSATFTPDGKRILTGGRDYTLRLWNGHSGKFLRELPDPPRGAVDSIRFSPDGKRVAIAESSGLVTIRPTSTWKPVATIDENSIPVSEAVFSPNGKLVATASLDGYAGIYSARTGERIRWLHANGKSGAAHPLGAATGIAWSSDGRFLATTATDSRIHIWSPRGVLLQTMLGHAGRVVSPSFAPHSHLLLTAGADHTARVWDAATGTPLAVLKDDPQALAAAAFSPDGSRVVTGDAGGLTQVWRWQDGRLLGTLPMHSDSVNAVSFSPDGKSILSASNDSTAKIYRCETCGSLGALRKVVERREQRIHENLP